jgi:hypothetical protein
MHKAVKIRLNSGNAYWHLDHNLLSSHLLHEHVKVRIYGNTMLHVVWYGCETWSLILKEKHRLRVFKNTVLWEDIWV